MTARLAIFESDHAVVVDQVAPPKAVLLELRMDVRELPYSSGLGKAMPAEMPADRMKEIVGEVGLKPRDADGVFCVGSPLRDRSGTCVGAISITGLSTISRRSRSDPYSWSAGPLPARLPPTTSAGVVAKPPPRGCPPPVST